MSNSKKIIEELDSIKDYLVDNKDASIEKLVIKLLEPELKKWLNKNLPSIVKQVVNKEIKKIIPKNG